MQRLTVAQRSFLVGNGVAALVLEYAALLGRIRGSDIVRLAALDEDQEARVSIALLLNAGTQLLAEDAGDGPEPDNGSAERYLRGRLDAYTGAVVPPLGAEAVAS
ncbi:hypothetical protein QDR37_05440 [Amnibacterium sp. CER49]|uniref:hypothetical protein n=1 Tax=Amnibacterium sp. CER49 TaxID=3039161 RepID=UPI00244ADBE0|nr:hypothetical protein [Amnibacterium sp. CER49]MDH2443384.1 hypothetical protein [Amnibacterium sp. CER49]